MRRGRSAARIRVDLLAPSLFPGGAKRQMLYLAAGLPREIFCRALPASCPERGPLRGRSAKALGIPIELLGLDRARVLAAAPAGCAGMAARALRRSRVTRHTDIVDAWTVPAYTFAGLARPFTRVPVVLAGRRSLPGRGPDANLVSRGRPERSRCAASTRSSPTRGRAAADAASRARGRSRARIHVIHNAVEVASDRVRGSWRSFAIAGACPPQPASSDASDHSGPGRDMTLLLELAAELRVSHPDVRLVLVGDGPLRPAIEGRDRRSIAHERGRGSRPA